MGTMRRFISILPVAVRAAAVPQALSTSTSSISAAATLQSAIEGNYTGLFRPQVHFSPPTGFMNDPNGLHIDAQGVYHQYYQYNPYDTVAGNQTWGHATSTDLYHWIVQPVAIAPSNGTDLIFSGSAVIDVNNTSGFFPNQDNGVVAIYTIDTPVQQSQGLAYSFDSGYTFEKYGGNPVLQIDSQNFRDPKVFWHGESQTWVMVLSFAQDFTLGFYTSQNLKEWVHASNFTHVGLLGYQYECPNLVQMPMEGGNPMWLLYVSINPGAPIGGSIGQYFPGHFNGTHFTAVDAAARIADFGQDNYATQFWYGIPGDQPQLSIGWASNWEYTNRVPTGPSEGWASAFSLPRRNYLKNITRVGYDLVSEPYNIQAVTPNTILIDEPDFGNRTMNMTIGQGGSGAIMIDVNITNLNISTSGPVASINFTMASSETGEYVHGGQFFAGDNIFWLDRLNTNGFQDAFFVDKFSCANLFTDFYHAQIVIDRSVLEAFILDGEKSGTMTFFPTARLDTVSIVSDQLNPGAQVHVKVLELVSTWTGRQNAQGLYVGNTTTLAT